MVRGVNIARGMLEGVLARLRLGVRCTPVPLLLLVSLFFAPYLALAQTATQCAEVRIEIAQELSFERQAFEGRMRISNNLSATAINNVSIALRYTDNSGSPVQASSIPSNPGDVFFHRIEQRININDTNGNGTIQPSTTAEVVWLIIPSPGAANNSPQGARYFIGATLNFTVNGEPRELEVAPDFITVRPQPELQLDYFLPTEVRGDDPLTPGIEPAVPFTLGVRISNLGLGVARNTRIESAQPRIVENQSNLLIGFQIVGGFVGADPVTPSLLLNFGDIASLQSKVGRWVMESTLTGEIDNFTASFSHLDELGGRTTSLLRDPIRTHDLIKDVLVDLPGRDDVADFLAADAGVPRLYESEGVDSSVTDQSSGTTTGILGSSGGVTTHFYDVPVTAGALYIKRADPYNGQSSIRGARRQQDGKVIRSENVWLTTEGQGGSTQRFMHLFDVNGGGRYLVDFGPPLTGSQPPVMQFIPNRSVTEGNRLTFVVQATDPDSGPPTLTIDARPLGATFTDGGNGIGQFSWTPAVGQAGSYPVTFRASDGTHTVARTATITVALAGDSDQDGMSDSWESRYFGNLGRNGTGDFDGDGMSDLDEFRNGTDPTLSGNAPSVPHIQSPLNYHRVPTATPTLAVENSRHGVDVPSYRFELFADERYENLLAVSGAVPEGSGGVTSWQVPSALSENAWYFWRVRSELAAASSPWSYGRFQVDQTNQPPVVTEMVFPAANDIVDSYSPKLTIVNPVDPEGERVRYIFGVLGTENGVARVVFALDIPASPKGVTSWTAQIPPTMVGPFSWAVAAFDERNAYSITPWVPFTIQSNSGVAPRAPFLRTPYPEAIVTGSPVDIYAKGAVDPDSTGLTYTLQVDTLRSFDSPNLRTYGPTPFGNDVHFRVADLEDDTTYFWRLRAFDGTFFGPWSESSFRVNLQNSAPATSRPLNPERGARVDSRRPRFEALPALDAEDSVARFYTFEIYDDQFMTTLLHRERVATPWWTVGADLPNFTSLYWRVRSEDTAGAVTPWSPLAKFYVGADVANDPPHIRLVAPATNQSFGIERGFDLRWDDEDADSNAGVYFYVNNVRVNAGRTEDDDYENDVIRFSPFSLPTGTYDMNAAIDDGTTEFRDTSCCRIVVNPWTPTLDSDGDGIVDVSDNCPYAFNPSQLDTGGIGPGSIPDGIGDACQCGDLDGNGRTEKNDAKILDAAISGFGSAPIPRPELCNVKAPAQCDEGDVQQIVRMLEKADKGTPKLCAAAIP